MPFMLCVVWLLELYIFIGTYAFQYLSHRHWYLECIIVLQCYFLACSITAASKLFYIMYVFHVYVLCCTIPHHCTGCSRKNSLIWEGHSFGWGARRWTVVYVPFSVYTMAWSGEHRAFIVEEFIRNGVGSLVATQRAFCIRRIRQIWPPVIFFLWGYLKAKVYEQRPLTLEALKEAILQEVAAITPEMILKVTDN